MVIVNFKNVGRNKKKWKAKLKKLSYKEMYDEVRKNGQVMSRDLEFQYNENSNKAGKIIAGFRKIGEFEVV